jgi:hypothetical protein
MSELLQRCSGPCHGNYLLLVLTERGALCPGCWRAAGEPSALMGTETEVHEQLQRTRERMVARGGTARHLVRKGLT